MATRIVHTASDQLTGFQKFILRGNVVDLAVGILIGAAFGNVVQALVKDFLTPLISLFGGAPDFASLVLVVGQARFGVGDFINALISFLLIALVIYFFVVQPVNALMARYRPEPEPAPTKTCPECLTKIPQDARRCSACAVQLLPPSEQVAEAMRQVAGPSGADIAEHAARVLAGRLTGSDGGQESAARAS
jgi:large conductance mechanosensitive channel